MPTFSLGLGTTTTIPQNAVYALPARACYLTYSAAVEGAFDIAGPWTADAAAPGGAHVSGMNFIRCTTGPVIVTVKII
jgi:hypothetical protein